MPRVNRKEWARRVALNEAGRENSSISQVDQILNMGLADLFAQKYTPEEIYKAAEKAYLAQKKRVRKK